MGSIQTCILVCVILRPAVAVLFMLKCTSILSRSLDLWLGPMLDACALALPCGVQENTFTTVEGPRVPLPFKRNGSKSAAA